VAQEVPKLRPILDDGLRFGEKKKSGPLASSAQCQERIKTLRFKKPLNWKQTIDFSTRKGLEFDTFRLCAMFYAALAKCLRVERYALSGVRFCDLIVQLVCPDGRCRRFFL
jgi:hypothetical protein